MSTMIELAKRLNIAFYYWLFLFVFFIAGRTSISMAICVSAIAAIGVGNYFVVMFRSNPIVPWDIYSFETAMSVADNYVFSVDLGACRAHRNVYFNVDCRCENQYSSE